VGLIMLIGIVEKNAIMQIDGAGGEARRPLSLVVASGLLFSQLVTLYLTPVFYTYMAALQSRVRAWRGRKRVETEAPVTG
jgi:HAE1 family hydrophobic/amphiphilic exporter-1